MGAKRHAQGHKVKIGPTPGSDLYRWYPFGKFPRICSFCKTLFPGPLGNSGPVYCRDDCRMNREKWFEGIGELERWQ